MCVCVRERERESASERESARERESESVCMRERARVRGLALLGSRKVSLHLTRGASPFLSCVREFSIHWEKSSLYTPT